MIRRLLPLLAILAAFAAAQNPPIAFTHVTVIDATGAPPKFDQTVVIANGKIAWVGPAKAARLAKRTEVRDSHDRYLIPGLWDMHAHAFGEATPHLLPLFYFQLSLANGVTGLRDMAGFFEDIDRDKQWRTALQAGAVDGPEMIMSGTLVDGPNPTYPGKSLNVADERQGRAAVTSLKQRGMDFIKVYNMLPPEAFRGIAEEAKAEGIPFAGHVPLAVPAGVASDAGQASFEHLWGLLLGASSREAELREKMLAEANRKGTRPSQLRPHTVFARELAASYDDAKATALFAKLKANHTYQTPTLAVLHMLAYIEELRAHPPEWIGYVPPALVEQWNPAKDWRLDQRNADEVERSHLLFDQDMKLVRALHAAGVPIMAGTDSTEPYTYPGFSLHEELEWLVKAGLSPMEAIQSATRTPAEFLGRRGSAGTVERGKDADLVLLSADPLADIRNTRKIAGVVRAGKYYDRAALDTMLARVRSAAQAH
jgi:imidazolonepropionase-like amidohydrolase